MKLLSIGVDAKTVKGEKRGYLTGVMYLAPVSEAGIGNVCPMASNGCATACLFTAGRGRYNSVRQARINRTHLFFNDRPAFMEKLIGEIEALERKAKKLGMKPCVRLNGTSDIQWERIKYKGKTIFQHFPSMKFYDYTKIPARFSRGELPKNYNLTFSRSESNVEYVKQIIKNHVKVNVAVVFNKLPKTYLGRKVFDADQTDLRFLDPKGVIVGLKAKGKARHDKSGFVVDAERIAA